MAQWGGLRICETLLFGHLKRNEIIGKSVTRGEAGGAEGGKMVKKILNLWMTPNKVSSGATIF